jgi:hypothetical protein
MPMTDFRVVVFPAPLRPSSVTTSPCHALRTIDAVQDVRFPVPCLQIVRRQAADRVLSSIAGPHIGLTHLRVVADTVPVIALGKNASARQHGDALSESFCDDAEIMFDHQDRAVGRD